MIQGRVGLKSPIPGIRFLAKGSELNRSLAALKAMDMCSYGVRMASF
jgi:hypothetical protein